ncbi:MAG: response regulator, partial [Proteobacteria bacterium]|nr:response regulator [Pseudomonadota bacterium]
MPVGNESPVFRRVLLVEDDPSHALLIKRSLRGLAEEVQHVVTLAAASQALHEAVPDLIVTDLHLPDADSQGPLPILLQQAPQTPVIVLTSSTSLHDAVEAMKLGARDFVVKDFDVNFQDVLGLAISRVSNLLAAERERQRLQREMDLLRVSIENNQDGLALVDASGSIHYSNRSFVFFSVQCGGNGHALADIFADDVILNASNLRQSITRSLSQLSDGGAFSTEVIFKADKTTAFELSLSSLPSPGQRTFAVWVRDRSAQKKREKFQREILSTTTHDLKGPLGAVLISADLLGGLLKDNQKGKELALRIGSSAQGAINLIDEFLSARRIQEGTLILKPSLHDVCSLVREAAADFETIAAARSITLELAPNPEAVRAQVDRLGLIRVVSNLISNAIKFTPKGGKVSVGAWQVGEEVHVQV